MHPIRPAFGPVLFAIAIALGCSESTDHPALVLKGDGFFDRPWPSDTRTVGGQLDMTGFPGRGEIALLDTYLEGLERLSGFGTNSPLYARLDTAPGELPQPENTTDSHGPVFLIDIDPRSPERGMITPVSARLQEAETPWQPQNLLAFQPVWGFPLRPSTTYSMVYTTDFIAPATDWDMSRNAHPDLYDTLAFTATDPGRVAYATRFTTQDPVIEMARFQARIETDLSLPSLTQTVERFRSNSQFHAYEGTLWLPMWQHGTKPYLVSGGGFVFDEAGWPVLAGWEEVLFTLTIPRVAEMPAEGWPVVLYGHGTGGDNRSFASGLGNLVVARRLAEEGIAGIGVSLPLHGDRGTGIDPALVSFNYLNPDSARACFRQAALDVLYLAELLSSRSHGLLLSDGGSVALDPDRLAYMGHSHGGLVGAIAAPFVGERFAAIMLSGAGGGLSTTVVTRDAGDFDIQELIEDTFEFGEDDDLVQSHPLVGMVQTLSEVTDPINYAPYWHQRTPHWDSTPHSVLLTEGLNDLQTPPETAESLAAAGGMPILAPAAHVSIAHKLKEIGQVQGPTQGNVQAWDGTRVSSALAQFGDEDHFAVFNNPEASDLWLHFLSSALDGELPTIEDH